MSKVVLSQAQEYAARLEQAQDTIHSLSEPKLQDEEDILSMHHGGYNTYSVSSHEGGKESEITKVHIKSVEGEKIKRKEEKMFPRLMLICHVF